MQENSTAADAMSMLDLISIQNILNEYDLPTAILEKSADLPLNSLIVNSTNDYKDRTRTLSFSFLPLESEHFPDVKLLQIFSEFNIDVVPTTIKAIEQLLVKLNILLPLGSLGLTDGNRIYFRYVHTLAKYDNLSEHEQTLVNIFNLFMYSLNVNARVLEEVATGAKTIDVAYADFIKS